VSDEQVRIILTTFGSEDDAAQVIAALVAERSIACGTLVPGVRSLYRWQGAVEDAREVLALLKTGAGRVAACVERLGELHPYDVPEILVLPIEVAAASYLRWVLEETGAG